MWVTVRLELHWIYISVNRNFFSQVDLSSIVSGHMDYADKIDEILVSLGYAEDDDGTHILRKSSSSHNLRAEGSKIVRSQSLDSLVLVKKCGVIGGARIGGK